MSKLNGKVNSVKLVVSNSQCMSCGMCKSACPREAISMVYTDDGFFRPTINEMKCCDCGICLRTCPAKHQERTDLIGNYIRLCLAHSANSDIRHDATSGGVINSLIRYLLDKNLVEAVLLTQYSATSVIEAEPNIVTKNTEYVLINKTRDFASRYVSVPVLSELANYVRQYKKIAVVGTPCQIKAVTLWGGGKSNVDIFKIGLTCSGGMSYKATEEYKRNQKLKVSKMYYRGNGWPGTNCLITSDKKIEFGHQGSLFERMFSSQIFKNPGCRRCMDHFAEFADISFCDFWNSKELESEKEGNSCVIIRNQKFLHIFDEMQNDGYTEVVRELDEDELIKTQYNVLLHKKGNVREKREYRLFTMLLDTVFKHRIYKLFNIRVYRKFCSYYNKICSNSHI